MIHFSSYSDIITNSSTTIYTRITTPQSFEMFLDKILKACGHNFKDLFYIEAKQVLTDRGKEVAAERLSEDWEIPNSALKNTVIQFFTKQLKDNTLVQKKLKEVEDKVLKNLWYDLKNMLDLSREEANELASIFLKEELIDFDEDKDFTTQYQIILKKDKTIIEEDLLDVILDSSDSTAVWE